MLIFVTHRGNLTHICIGDLTIIVSDNGLSPNRRQAIFWTEVGILFRYRLDIHSYRRHLIKWLSLMIYIFYKMLMLKMLNVNECIFWCVCVCGWGGGVVVVVAGGGGGGGGGGRWAFSIHYVSAVINSVWKCMLFKFPHTTISTRSGMILLDHVHSCSDFCSISYQSPW